MQIRQNISLKPYHTFGIDSKAAQFASFSSATDLLDLLQNNNPASFLILGGGSNVVFTKDFSGMILHNCIMGRTVLQEEGEEVLIRVGAGESWHELVLWAIERNYGGLENLSLIPGTVGAAPIQNIGAYGVELKDVFESLTAIDLVTHTTLKFDKAACQFGYRDSIFKKQKGRYCITQVDLRLRQKNHQLNTSYGAIQNTLQEMGELTPSIQTISQAVIQIRTNKLPDPQQIGNAGSFFKNPIIPKATFGALKETFPNIIGYPQNEETVKVPAGWLIEQTGWKGQSKGQVGCYAHQALVLINLGHAIGHEVLAMVETIQEAVQKKFGIQLTPEVNLV